MMETCSICGIENMNNQCEKCGVWTCPTHKKSHLNHEGICVPFKGKIEAKYINFFNVVKVFILVEANAESGRYLVATRDIMKVREYRVLVSISYLILGRGRNNQQNTLILVTQWSYYRMANFKSAESP